uniref:UBA domain-containing protein n=1 Tax=Steinernema glaseri TaxID=37863 RepID=A0A1I7YYW3_9BILA
MSSHPRSEFIVDVPLDVNYRRILPPATVPIPNIAIEKPRILSVEYDFTAEKKAIAAYNEVLARRKEAAKQKELRKNNNNTIPGAPSTSSSSSTTSSPVPSTSIYFPDGVLKPTVVERKSVPKPNVENGSASSVVAPNVSTAFDLKDFESATNLFDLMELKTIDDKAELEKLLRSTGTAEAVTPSQTRTLVSSSASLFSQPTTSVPNPTIPILQNTVSAPALIAMQAQRGKTSSPKILSAAGERLVKDKKFPREVVEYCEANLSQEEMLKLDYFVKALYNLTVKMKINKAEALIFLQSFNFDEKKRIVVVSDTAMQLCGMGFEGSEVLNALRASAGQRASALDHLLNRSTTASS